MGQSTWPKKISLYLTLFWATISTNGSTINPHQIKQLYLLNAQCYLGHLSTSTPYKWPMLTKSFPSHGELITTLAQRRLSALQYQDLSSHKNKSQTSYKLDRYHSSNWATSERTKDVKQREQLKGTITNWRLCLTRNPVAMWPRVVLQANQGVWAVSYLILIQIAKARMAKSFSNLMLRVIFLVIVIILFVIGLFPVILFDSIFLWVLRKFLDWLSKFHLFL